MPKKFSVPGIEEVELTDSTPDIFDTSVLNSAYFTSLNNIPNFPIDKSDSSFGKQNPFTGYFAVTSTKASTTVGGIIYSNQ